jgi:XRE family aerobic/anaerobic benzoate catabolism transcriptional regulator
MRNENSEAAESAFLLAFGERVRGERAKRGMSRKSLAHHAKISERYISQLESGRGNVSLLLLRQIASALHLPLSQLVSEDAGPPEFTLLVQLLQRLSPQQLQEARALLAAQFPAHAPASRRDRVALVGLRGAGKTTLGARLAQAREVPFIELDREIERLSGASLAEIHDLYGQRAYRRYESEALQQVLDTHPRLVLATGGGIVSEASTYERLLSHCFTVWVQTSPEAHLSRVLAQGDSRPISASSQAMDDLRRILEERVPLYAKADASINTHDKSEEESFAELLAVLGGGNS